ncbi:hypothetical protein J4457_03610 [Candidatus Woesearchaeota archaeon]|nr:hypothetical protein [Candidatus Woesearchaeota archaeon]
MSKKNHKIKYPKLLLLLITIVIAFILFYEGRNYAPFHVFLISLGYFGTFLGGIFYAYGFTAAPATAILLVLAKEQNLILAVLIGGLGAVLSDFLIFSFIRHSFIDEINKLKKEKFVKSMTKNGKNMFGRYYKHIFPTFAGFLIASPLPTEIGVTMIASIKNLSVKKFMVIAYLLHSLGIFIILVIGSAI